MDQESTIANTAPDSLQAKPSKSLVLAHKESILSRMAEGETVTKIAKSLGLTHAAISMQLASDPEYQAAKVIHHATRLDNAEESIVDSTDAFTLARAREAHRAFSWRASVECSRIWGNQTQAQTAFGSQGITINIGDIKQDVVIDGQSLKSED